MAKNNFKKDSPLLQSFLYILIGILMLIFRGSMLGILMTVAGIVFIVFGVIELLKKNWIGGTVSVVIGILIIVLGNLVVDVVLLVLGILMAVKGVISLISALSKKNKNLFSILFPLLTVICGILIAFASGSILNLMLIIVGILLLADGILGIIAEVKK